MLMYFFKIKSKSLSEINDFYRCWKHTKYYKTWKLKNKDRPKVQGTLNDLIFHDRGHVWSKTYWCSPLSSLDSLIIFT